MAKIILFFQAVILLFGCQSFGKRKVVSEWKVLENADNLTCSDWPQSPKDLNIQKIQILKGDQVGFVSEVLQRNGSKQYYFSEYEGGVKIEPNDLEDRSFGSSSLLAGGGYFDNQLQAVVVVNGEKNKSRLEIRSMKDNVIRFSTADNLKNVQTASSYNTRSGLWMLYKTPQDDTSETELTNSVYYVPIDSKSQKSSFESFKNSSFPPQAQMLLPNKGQDAFVVWPSDEKDKKVFTLSMQQLQSKNSQVTPTRKVDLPLRFELESWAAAATAEGIYVAYVDGNSLVGQAVLSVAMIRWNDGAPLLNWSKESMLTNEHVSIPIWSTAKNDQLYVMLPKWVDEESTIATYKVSSQGIEEKKVKGIFEKGIRIMDTFYDNSNDKLVAMLRQKGRLGWDFKLCELSL